MASQETPQETPQEAPQEAPRELSGAQHADSGPAGPAAHPVALVADDEAPMRTLLARVLGAYGFRVLAATDGHEALALADAHVGPIRLLVTDVEMPGLTGVEVAESLGASRPEVAVLFVSGRVSPHTVADAVRRPVALLAKPFTLEELRRLIVDLTGPLPTRDARGVPGAG